MMGAGSPKCLRSRALWLTGRVAPKPYPKSKLSCSEFSPTAWKTVKMRPSLRLFLLSQREQVGSTQSKGCFACAGRHRLGDQAPDGITQGPLSGGLGRLRLRLS